MDRQTIEFNYQNTINLVRQLESVAEDIKNVSDQCVKNSLQILSLKWNGENYKKFFSKGDLLCSKMNKKTGSVVVIASTISEIARTIYEAELEALRIAEERAYQARLAEEAAKKKAEEEAAAKASSNNGKHSGGGRY
jgi:uncharacterized protein YukE